MSDALATLQKALTPRTGMQRIPLTTESYQYPSAPLSSKRLLNFFAEPQPADARAPVALVPTPGLSVLTNIGTGPIESLTAQTGGGIYVVSGSHLFRQGVGPLDPSTLVDLGDIGTPEVVPLHTFSISTAFGPTAFVVVVPPNAFTCSHTGSLSPIVFPDGGAVWVTYLDGYFVFKSDDDGTKFFISALEDPTTFDALDFANADAVPNDIFCIITLRGDLWMMGIGGIEVWYDSGNLDFPLRRRPGVFIPYGTVSAQSVALVDGSVFWQGQGGIIYRSQGYQAQRISTFAIESIINNFSSTAPNGAIAYTLNGHAFYAVTYENEQTFVYDCATQKWADRSSFADGNGRWLPGTTSVQADTLIFGDSSSNALWTTSPNIATEAGVNVLRQIVLPPLWAGTNRAFLNRLEVEMGVGASVNPPSVLLEWSNDGGITWVGSRTMSTGSVGQTTTRVYATRLGSFRQRVFRLSMNGHTTIYAVDADITAPMLGG